MSGREFRRQLFIKQRSVKYLFMAIRKKALETNCVVHNRLLVLHSSISCNCHQDVMWKTCATPNTGVECNITECCISRQMGSLIAAGDSHSINEGNRGRDKTLHLANYCSRCDNRGSTRSTGNTIFDNSSSTDSGTWTGPMMRFREPTTSTGISSTGCEQWNRRKWVTK